MIHEAKFEIIFIDQKVIVGAPAESQIFDHAKIDQRIRACIAAKIQVLDIAFFDRTF